MTLTIIDIDTSTRLDRLTSDDMNVPLHWILWDKESAAFNKHQAGIIDARTRWQDSALVQDYTVTVRI